MEARNIQINTQDQERDEAFEKLFRLVSNRSKEDFKQNSALKLSLQNLILEFNDQYSVKIIKYLGGGYWSHVFLVSDYDKNNQQVGDKKYVLKMLKPSPENAVRHFLSHHVQDNIVHPNQQFMDESILNKKMHGTGELKQIFIEGAETSFILIPYLGKENISSLLKETDQLKHIPLKEWLKFFASLLLELQAFHQKTNCIHNDIKPDNLIVTLEQNKDDSSLKFSDIHFIDYGNAHKVHGCGVIGTPPYNPFLFSLLGYVIPIKDERVDVCALGYSFLEILKAIENNFKEPDEQKILEDCKAIFSRMTGVYNPLPLNVAIDQMNRCQSEFNYIEKHENETFANALNDFLISAKIELIDMERSSLTYYFSFWSNSHKIKDLRTNIDTAEKMLKLINNEPVEFNSAEKAALNHGGLADIISRYRMEDMFAKESIDKENVPVFRKLIDMVI